MKYHTESDMTAAQRATNKNNFFVNLLVQSMLGTFSL